MIYIEVFGGKIGTMNLGEFLLNHEEAVRLFCFLGILSVMAIWEILASRRTLRISKLRRWISNLGLLALNTILLRLLFPAAAVGAAWFAASHQWGVSNYLDLPPWLAVVLSVVALDLIIYLQHVMFHAVPAFWRLHRVHHADLDFDVTTGAPRGLPAVKPVKTFPVETREDGIYIQKG